MREREKEREEKRKKILRAIHSNSSAGVLDVKTAYNGQPATALFNVSVAQSGGASSKSQRNAVSDDSYIYVEGPSVYTTTLNGVVSRVEKRKKSWVSARGGKTI